MISDHAYNLVRSFALRATQAGAVVSIGTGAVSMAMTLDAKIQQHRPAITRTAGSSTYYTARGGVWTVASLGALALMYSVPKGLRLWADKEFPPRENEYGDWHTV